MTGEESEIAAIMQGYFGKQRAEVLRRIEAMK
jgi:hypothetical protein